MTVTIRPSVTIRPNVTVKGFTSPTFKFDASNADSYSGTGTHWLNTVGTDGVTYGFGSAEFGSYGSIKWGGDSSSSWLVGFGSPGSPIYNTINIGDAVVIDSTTVAKVVGSGALPGTATGYYAGQSGFQLDIIRGGVLDWDDYNVGTIRVVHKNASLIGDVTYTTGPSALNFTGTGVAEQGYAQVSQGVYFNHSFTAEGWVYVNSITTWARLFDFGGGPGDDNVIIAVSQLSSGYPVFSCGGQNLTSNAQLPLNQWVHLLATYDYHSQTGTLYMNGTQVVQGYQPRKLQNNNQYYNYIGKSNWTGDADLEGAVGELAVYPFAMSSSQVSAQYDSRKTHYGL